MNKKLIAAAVSAAVVAPVTAYGEVTVYGRINNAIDLNDLNDIDDDNDSTNDDSTTHLSGIASRFGIKYNKEMGNGMTAHGKYEFGTTTDKEGGGVEDTRIATVGLSGPFGRIDVGNQWSSYFNTVGTLISPTYTLGAHLYNSVGGGPFRASNTIKYSNSFGPLHAELDVRLNDDSDPEGSGVAEKLRGDGIGLGLSWAVTDSITIAAAWDNEDGEDDDDLVERVSKTNSEGPTPVLEYDDKDGRRGEEDRIGIAVKGTFGNYWAALGWQNYELSDLDVIAQDLNDDGDTLDPGETTTPKEEDIDTMFIWGGGNLGERTRWMLGYSEADDDNDDVNDDPEQFTWGIYHKLGGGLTLYYEATSVEAEAHELDGDRHLLGMLVSF